MIEEAPFHQLSGDPRTPATAFWLEAEDGVRLRLAIWRCEGIQPRGGVFLFPGRTEYIEKYAPFARLLTDAGYEVLAIDWRGQGMSDRLLEDPRPGHISNFADYRRDVIEMVVAASKIDLPEPWHLLGHSMGGCIGLAALHADLPVQSAVFSAPMWGIELRRVPRFIIQPMAMIAGKLGFGGHATPGNGGTTTYYVDESFGSNVLTHDLGEWTRLLREAVSWPELTIGGASYDWVAAALKECSRLAQLPSPDLPMSVALGWNETVVSTKAIRDRAGRWNDAKLLEYENCKHEIMAETPDLRERFLDAALRQFDSVG